MSDLLKESIADAKAVRETALANAKTFLEESFNASVKEMFAEKLKEEMAEENLGSSKIGKDHGLTAGETHPVQPSAVASKTSTEKGKQQFDVELEEESTEVTSEELDEILAELESEVSEVKSEEEGVMHAEAGKEEEESVNLDELLAELEAEEASVPATPAAPAVPAPAQAQAQASTEAPAPAPEVGQVPSPVAEAAKEEEEEGVTAEEMAEALIAINEENESLKSQLEEAINTVKYMKSVLNETNLLNAKLLYTNKLFKGKSLTEEQKLKIINTFDLTKNIREVKLAYTVLAESFNSGASVVKKKTNTTAQTITEGLASKPVSSTKPDSTIVEPQAVEMTSRFQKLAGIKK